MFNCLKSALLVLPAVVFSGNCFEQPDISFPDSGAVWTNSVYSNDPPPSSQELLWSVSYCAYGEDTLMLGDAYKKLHTCSAGYKGAIRVLDDRVFFVPRDSVQEYLVYDFNLTDGDTAYNVYWEGWGDGRVSNVGIHSDLEWPLVTGRRAFYTDIGFWVQGIGGYGGLFVEAGPNLSNVAFQLDCMSRWDTVLVGGGSSSCVVISSTPDPVGSSTAIAFPNPTNGMVSIRTANYYDQPKVRIFSTTGTELFVPTKFLQEELKVDLHALDPGLYLIEVTERGRRQVHKVRLDRDQ